MRLDPAAAAQFEDSSTSFLAACLKEHKEFAQNALEGLLGEDSQELILGDNVKRFILDGDPDNLLVTLKPTDDDAVGAFDFPVLTIEGKETGAWVRTISFWRLKEGKLEAVSNRPGYVYFVARHGQCHHEVDYRFDEVYRRSYPYAVTESSFMRTLEKAVENSINLPWWRRIL